MKEREKKHRPVGCEVDKDAYANSIRLWRGFLSFSDEGKKKKKKPASTNRFAHRYWQLRWKRWLSTNHIYTAHDHHPYPPSPPYMLPFFSVSLSAFGFHSHKCHFLCKKCLYPFILLYYYYSSLAYSSTPHILGDKNKVFFSLFLADDQLIAVTMQQVCSLFYLYRELLLLQ